MCQRSLRGKNAIQPKIPEERSGCLKRLAMQLGVRAEARGGDANVMQFAGMANVPGFEAVGGDFRMELERQCVVSDGEGLIGVALGLGEMKSARGQVESISVPMKDGERGREERSEPFGRRHS